MCNIELLERIRSKVEGSKLFDNCVICEDYNQVRFLSKRGIFKYQFRELVDGDGNSSWHMFYARQVRNQWVWNSNGGRSPRIPRDELEEINKIQHWLLFEI